MKRIPELAHKNLSDLIALLVDLTSGILCRGDARDAGTTQGQGGGGQA